MLSLSKPCPGLDPGTKGEATASWFDKLTMRLAAG
jgi:hypothetical protein